MALTLWVKTSRGKRATGVTCIAQPVEAWEGETCSLINSKMSSQPAITSSSTCGFLCSGDKGVSLRFFFAEQIKIQINTTNREQEHSHMRWDGWEELFSNLIELAEIIPVAIFKIDFSPKLVNHIATEFLEILLWLPAMEKVVLNINN